MSSSLALGKADAETLVENKGSRHFLHIQKLSLRRPGEVLRAPGSSKFLDSRHMQVVRLSGLRTVRIYPQGISLPLISFRGCVRPRAAVGPEGLMTPSGFECVTFRIVAQWLNQLCHPVPPKVEQSRYRPGEALRAGEG
jgi:hypothetical protein